MGLQFLLIKLKKVVIDFKEKGKVAHDITAGFDVQPVDARIARYFGMKTAARALLSAIFTPVDPRKQQD